VVAGSATESSGQCHGECELHDFHGNRLLSLPTTRLSPTQAQTMMVGYCDHHLHQGHRGHDRARPWRKTQSGSQRRMKDATTDYLNYALYLDAARTTVWGSAKPQPPDPAAAPDKTPRRSRSTGESLPRRTFLPARIPDTVVATVQLLTESFQASPAKKQDRWTKREDER